MYTLVIWNCLSYKWLSYLTVNHIATDLVVPDNSDLWAFLCYCPPYRYRSKLYVGLTLLFLCHFRHSQNMTLALCQLIQFTCLSDTPLEMTGTTWVPPESSCKVLHQRQVVLPVYNIQLWSTVTETSGTTCVQHTAVKYPIRDNGYYLCTISRDMWYYLYAAYSCEVLTETTCHCEVPNHR